MRVLAYSLTLFLAALSTAYADEQLELPKKITDLRAPPAGDAPTSSSESTDFAALKSSLKFEILDELRGDKNFNWKQPSKAKLNFLELAGYFRTRSDALNRCDLGTYIPSLNRGTSQCPPPIGYFNDDPASDDVSISRPNWLLSADLRFRLDPTLNVSEDIRIKGRFDFLDNLVFGSTSDYMTGEGQPNPTFPFAILSGSQNPPFAILTSRFGPLAIKRLWGEVSFPYGEFRFGRMPFAWGLGLLYNAGDDIDQDFGNNVDGFFFETRVAGHILTPGFTVSYVGPTGKGGGLGAGGDNNIRWLTAEGGDRYDLDPSDNVYNFHISFARKDSQADIDALLDDNRMVLNYGALVTYRFQINDSTYFALSDDTISTLRKNQIARNAHLGLLSLWSKFQIGDLYIEGEAAGIFGQIGNGQKLFADPARQDSISIYQGGVAIESRYGFLQNRLQVGLDGGWASGDSAPGFGIRPGINKSPTAGVSDGEQAVDSDTAITNFAFDRDFRVDLILFREVLGTVTDAFYLKPHIAYYFTENLGISGDMIGSMSNFSSTTPGNNQFLGIELDANLFFKTCDGFVFNLQYGYLFPFSGLNHDRNVVTDATIYSNFGTASSASALRFLAGITF